MKIKELTQLTTDLLSTEKFYTEVLNFKIQDKQSNKITFIVGESLLTFILCEKIMKPTYHFAFLVPNHKIKETKIWISNKIKILEAGNKDNMVTFENWKAQSFYFYDNNKNLLECIAREDYSDELFQPSIAPYVININEVGIATDLPLSISEIIIQKTKINYFAKGPVREDFAALGTEEGLFVISKDDRNWFPTSNLAEKHFLKVKFEVLGKVYEETFN